MLNRNVGYISLTFLVFVLQTVLASQNRADFVALDLELGDSSKMQHLKESQRKRKIEPWYGDNNYM